MSQSQDQDPLKALLKDLFSGRFDRLVKHWARRQAEGFTQSVQAVGAGLDNLSVLFDQPASEAAEERPDQEG